MARTSILRAQHDHAERLFDELFERLDRFDAAAEVPTLIRCLCAWPRSPGILRTHFAIEDRVLYPTLIASENREVAVVARVFEREIGNLADQFERFLHRWGRSAEIAAAIPQFRYECDMMFSALRDRIGRENRELYPIADRENAELLRRAVTSIPVGTDAAAIRPGPVARVTARSMASCSGIRTPPSRGFRARPRLPRPAR